MSGAYYNEIDPKAAAWLRELIKQGHIAPGDVDERSIVDIRPSDLRGYTQCHFFAGIGVWSYALRLAGWPDDRPVWTGSCPCQPFSAAGKRGGVNDERHLWPELFRLIRECRPYVCFGEQVASKDGLAWLDVVQTDLEGAGYAVGAVDTCAAGFGAPHIRKRLYFVAEPGGDGCGPRRSEREGQERTPPFVSESESCELADADNEGSQGRGCGFVQKRAGKRTARENGGPCNGFWSDAEWIWCRDEKFRPVEPKFIALPDGSSSGVGSMCDRGDEETKNTEEKVNVRSAETGCGEVLRGLRQEVIPSEVQRSSGIESGVLQEEVLQSEMHGGRLQEEGLPEQKLFAGESPRENKRCVRIVREDRAASCASHRWKSAEQHEYEFEDFVRLLPSSLALAQLHGDTRTSEVLSALLQASSKDRIMQYAPYQIAEIWRSITEEDQDRLRVAFTEGRFVRTIEHPLAHGASARVGRLRGYGNAIVAPQATAFVESYMEVTQEMLPVPINAKGKPFTWSPTAISDFDSCPYRYAAKRYFCSVVEAPTEASIWGERVHKAFEERIRDGKTFPEGMEEYEKWARVLEAVPGEKFFEREFAVNQRLEPCGWFDKNAYGRVKVDLLIVDRAAKKALLVDYKTGKPKADESQLKIYCWFVLKAFPEIETFNYKYIWLKTGGVTGGVLPQYDALGQFLTVVERLKVMEQAWRDENFPMNPSGLCKGWCSASDCVHWREKK